MVKFWQIKKEIRIIGIDDASFDIRNDKEVVCVGTIFRGSQSIDGILCSKITIDSLDATDTFASMISSSRHKKQLRVIMLDGITYGGFNIVDIHNLFEQTGLPVISVTRSMPDFEKIKKALEHFNDGNTRWNMIKRAGNIHEFFVKKGVIYSQFVGIDREDVRKILEYTIMRGYIPEPIRVAHLIATAIVRGESHGRA